MQRILAAGLIAIFVALSALHVFWAAGGRAGGAVAIPRHGGEALFTPSPLATLAVAVALAAAAATVAAAAGWFGAGGRPRAGRVLTAACSRSIFLFRALGDFRYVGFFKSLGDDPFRSWDTVAVLAAVPGDRARGADRGQEPRTLSSDHSIRKAADGSMRPVRRAGIQAAMPPTSRRTATAAAKMRGSPGSMPKSTVFRSPAPA